MPYQSFKDTFDNGGGSAVNLEGWSITHPHPTLGGTGWESTDASDAIQVQTWDAIRSTSGATAVFRTDGDFKDDLFELQGLMARLATDAVASCAMCFHIKDTTIGSFDNREYYRVLMARQSVGSVVFYLHHIDASGTVVEVGAQLVNNVFASSFGSPSFKWVKIRVEGLRCRVWIDGTEDFATEVLIIDETLPVDYRGSNHKRVGVQLGAASAGDFVISEFRALDLVPTDGGITDPSTLAGTIATGLVARVERRDGEVEEWVLANHVDDRDRNQMTMTFIPVAAWFAERVQVRSTDGLAVAYDGALDTVLDQLLATGDWPAFVVAGTVAVTPRIAGTWTQANGTAALVQMIADANAAPEIVLARQVVRYEFRRVSATQWAIDILVAAASGTPALVEGKQVTRGFKLKRDRTRDAQVIYPANGEGTSIAYAYFRVSNVASDITVTLTDWSTGPDHLAVVEDGQWVGRYLVAPDGTTYLITASSAAEQSVTCASLTAGDINEDDLVRFADAADATPSLSVALPDRKNPKQANINPPFPTATNWARNSQWRTLDGSTAEPEGWVASAGAETALSIETNPTYVRTGSQSLKWEPAAADELVTMDTFTVPIERWGSATVHYGVEYHALNPTAVTIEHFIVGSGAGSGSWVQDTVLTSDGDWHTRTSSIGYAYFMNTGFRIRLRSTNNIPIRVDRVWIFLAGEESDTTVEGCGPLRGLYYGNFELELRATGGMSFEVPIVDLHRRNPVLHAADKLRVHQLARLVYPSREVDTTLPITTLDVNELRAEEVKLTLGAIRQRITDLI